MILEMEELDSKYKINRVPHGRAQSLLQRSSPILSVHHCMVFTFEASRRLNKAVLSRASTRLKVNSFQECYRSNEHDIVGPWSFNKDICHGPTMATTFTRCIITNRQFILRFSLRL